MGTKISELNVHAPLDGTEYLEAIISPYTPGTNRRITSQQIANLGGTGSVASVTGDGVGGTATDPVITLKNGLPSADTTGVAIAFATPQIYGSPGTPETGNITLVTTGIVQGMVQVLYHDNGTEPTYPVEFVRLSGSYSTTVLNIIYMCAIDATRIEYVIKQEA